MHTILRANPAITCLTGLCLVNILVDAVAIDEKNSSTSPDLAAKVEHMNQLDRKYVERMRKAMIEANPKEYGETLFYKPTNEASSKGIALYLEQKTEGLVLSMVKNKFGVDDYRLMFSIYIVNPCMQVASELESFMTNVAPSGNGFASEWSEITKMCRNILDLKDALKERSFEILFSKKKTS